MKNGGGKFHFYVNLPEGKWNNDLTVLPHWESVFFSSGEIIPLYGRTIQVSEIV